MSGMNRFLFPQYTSAYSYSWLLLFLRVFFGGMLMYHGVEKIIHFKEYEQHFVDFLSLGPKIPLILSICAEVGCAFACAIGLLFRLITIPLMFNMLVATFGVGHPLIYQHMELPLIYLVMFCVLFITGPGKFAVDNLLASFFSKPIKKTTPDSTQTTTKAPSPKLDSTVTETPAETNPNASSGSMASGAAAVGTATVVANAVARDTIESASAANSTTAGEGEENG